MNGLRIFYSVRPATNAASILLVKPGIVAELQQEDNQASYTRIGSLERSLTSEQGNGVLISISTLSRLLGRTAKIHSPFSDALAYLQTAAQ